MKFPVRKIASLGAGACAIGVLATGCSSTLDPIGLQQHALDNGQIETGYPGVGSFDTPGDCTGTLIDPSWVLTAGHCSQANDRLEVFLVGPNPDEMTSHSLHVEEFGQPGSPGREVTLLRLVEPIYDVPTIQLFRGDLPIGKECKAIGYGWAKDENGEDVRGIKHSKTVTIVDASSNQFTTDGPLRGGDSGGPLLYNDQIVGIATTAAGIYATVDPDWVVATMANPTQPESGETTEPFTPEQRIVSARGELCEEGTVKLEKGDLYTLTSPYDADGDGMVGCSIEIAVSVPAGRTFAAPKICTTLYSENALPAPASLKYTLPGSELSDDAWIIPRTPDNVLNQDVERCDTLDYESATCADPSQASEIILNIELRAPIADDSNLSALSVHLHLNDVDAIWSDCE